MHQRYLALTIAAWVFTAIANPTPDPAPREAPQQLTNLPSDYTTDNNGGSNNNNDDDGDGDDNNNEAIVVVVNGQEARLELPPVGEQVHMKVLQPFVVEEATVKSAPLGVGCFFTSNHEGNSPPASAFQTSSRNFRSLESVENERTQNSFVTPTFYSAGSGVEGENLTLDPPFSNVWYLACFRASVKNDNPFYENNVVVQFEQMAHPGRVFMLNGEAVGIRTKFVTLSLNPFSASQKDEIRERIHGRSKTYVVTRAAIVHISPALASSVTCRIYSTLQAFIEYADFSLDKQLTTPISDVDAMFCQKSPDFDTSWLDTWASVVPVKGQR